jgi:hypothetical protein
MNTLQGPLHIRFPEDGRISFCFIPFTTAIEIAKVQQVRTSVIESGYGLEVIRTK